MQRLSLRFAIPLAIVCMVLALVAAHVADDQRPRLQVEGDSALVDSQMDVGEFAGTTMLGGFRGLAIDLLWMRANSAKEAGRFYESVALFQLISKTQPQFEVVWEYMAWDMAYNIAAQLESREAKYAWFLSGLQAANEGALRNPRGERLSRYLAWMFVHKGATFIEEVEATDWAPLLQPLFSRVGMEVPAQGSSPYYIGAMVYRYVLANGEQYGYQVPAFVRRIMPINLEHDGNLARNQGRHYEAVMRYLRSLRAWQEAAHWAQAEQAKVLPLLEAIEDQGSDRYRSLIRVADQARLTFDGYERNEGSLRRKSADIIRQLANTAAIGEEVAQAVLDRDFEFAEKSLMNKELWQGELTINQGIRWYDEEPIAP